MAVSRRRFLHHGVLAAAACAASPLLALGPKRPIGGNEDTLLKQPSSSSGSDNWQDHAAALQGITREQFSAEIGTEFKVVFPGGTDAPVWVRLMTVGDLPALKPVNPASFAVANRHSGTAPATSGFLLTFGSSAELQQGSYLFVHDALGQFALFVVPDGPQAYTAVINHLNAPTIIAVPFQTGGGAASLTRTSAPAAVSASPATSSGTDNPAADLSGSQGVRRGAQQD